MSKEVLLQLIMIHLGKISFLEAENRGQSGIEFAKETFSE